MNFKTFLRSLRAKQGFASAREQFEKLGGEEKLGMSLRNFQFVESGTNPPSAKFLGSLMMQIPKEEFRNAILAYFNSHFDERQNGLILKYLEQHLSAAENLEGVTLFDAPSKTVMKYSSEQMDLLAQNLDAMRLHHQLLLWEGVEKEKLEGREAAVDELIKLSLARRSKSGGLLPTRDVYHVPTDSTSPPHVVRRAVRYLAGVQDIYISYEGGANQELSFAMQLVTPAVAQLALEKMIALKSWIMKAASLDVKPGLVPFVYVAFGKSLSDREL